MTPTLQRSLFSMGAGRSSSLQQLISLDLKTNYDISDPHKDILSVCFTKAGIGRFCKHTVLEYQAVCLHKCYERLKEPKKHRNQHSHVHGKRKKRERLFSFNANKQLDLKGMCLFSVMSSGGVQAGVRQDFTNANDQWVTRSGLVLHTSCGC